MNRLLFLFLFVASPLFAVSEANMQGLLGQLGPGTGVFFFVKRVNSSTITITNNHVWNVGGYVDVVVNSGNATGPGRIEWAAGPGTNASYTYTFPATPDPVAVSIQYCGTVSLDFEAGPEKTVRLALRNTSDVPVTYRFVQDGVNRGELTLQPGQGIITDMRVPSNSDVDVQALVSGLVKDGPVWVSMPGSLTDVGTVATVTPVDVTPNPPPAPSIPEPDIPKPNPTNPGQPAPQNNKPVWIGGGGTGGTGGTTDGLTNALYREGVDHVVKALTDSAGFTTGNGFDQTSTVETSLAADPVLSLGVAKLPAPPTFGTLGTQSSFSWSYTPPLLSSPVTMNVDLSYAQSGIVIFKGIVRVMLAVLFFFAAVRTIRGAFAS